MSTIQPLMDEDIMYLYASPRTHLHNWSKRNHSSSFVAGRLSRYLLYLYPGRPHPPPTSGAT